MNKWSAHMLTGIEKMTRMMRAVGTSRTDECGPACWRGEARGVWRVARVAVVAVMAMVFGLGGLVTSADAVSVTYNTEKDSGTTLGFYTTDWSEGNGTDVPAPKYTSMSVGGTFGTAAGDRVEAINFNGSQEVLTVISGTVYASDTTITGISYRISLRERTTVADAYQFDLGYVDATGFTSFGSVTQAGATNVVTSYPQDLSAISGIAPAGSYLAIRSTATGGDGSNEGRVYPWETGAQSQLIVDEYVCTDTVPSSITYNGTNTATSDFNGTDFVTLTDISGPEFRITEAGAGPGTITRIDNWTNRLDSSNATLSAGSDRLMVVAADFEYGADPGSVTVTATCNGKTFTPLVNANGREYVWIGYLNDADAVVCSGNSIAVDFADGTDTGGAAEGIYQASYANVDQTTPLVDSQSSYNAAAPDRTFTNLATIDGGWAFYAIGTNGERMDPASGFTERWDENTANAGWSGNEITTNTTGAAISGTASTTSGNDDRLVIGIASIRPVGSSETIMLDWNADVQEAVGVLTGGNTYNLYARGTDATDTCNGTVYVGGGAEPGTSQSFTWTDCTDTDLATLTTGTNPATTVTGTTTVFATVGTETAPENMTGVTVTIGNSTCTDTGGAMTWSAGNTRWEYSWDTSSCGEPVESGVTIDVSGTDIDCSTVINATQISVNIDNATPPVAGTVTVSPDSGTKVPGDFTITTLFTDAETAVSGCDYTLNGSSWLAGIVSGAGPYTCTKNIVALPDSTPLVINMRASSGGGTTTATAINRTVDAIDPTVGIAVAASTSGTPVPFTVTFSETVTGFDASDIILGGTAGATTPVVSGTGPYTVNVTGMTGDGTITMDINAGAAVDSVGNASTAATQASTNWVSCTPVVTSLDISVVTNPINNPDTSSVINVVPTGGTVTGAEWSADGGSNWFASGTSYTAPTQSAGSVDITGRATEDQCSTLIPANNQPVTLNYDTRTDSIEVQIASAAQGGLTSINVTMPYLGDANGDATFQVDYKLASSGSWTNGTPTADTGGSPYTESITGLVSTETYDVRVTYDDPDGLTGAAATQSFVAIMVPWSDNDMLHNSLRFPGTTKHPAGALLEGWGQPGTYAGGITCATCHDKNTGNIKRIKATISYPDGTDMPGSNGTSATVSLQSAEDGTSDFGDDSGAPRGTSNKVCEVCHTYDGTQAVGTKFHAADQQVITGHYDNTDCIKCHEHKLGFAASCDSCHASPPVNSATDLVKDGSTPGDATGSATAGKHDTHANTLSYACNTCHTGWENTGEMPKAGQINVGIVTPGNDGGTYDGRSGGGGYNADAGTGTNVTTGGALTCAIYCHGNTIGGTTSTAVWNDAATISCGDCHKGTATQMQTGALGSHGRHAGNSTGATYQLNLTCDNCHGSVPSLGDTHMDGLVTWDVTALDGGTPIYNGNGNGSAGPAPTTYETCASVYCHSDVQNSGATVVSPTFATPTWGGAVSCGDCHGAAVTGRPTTGSHTKHNAYDCIVCHTSAGDETAKHADSEIDVDIANTYGATAAYSQTGTNPAGNGYGNCSNISCHGSGTPTWGATGSVACGDCHGTAGTFSDNRDGAPPVDLANLSDSFEVGKHQKHLGVSSSNTSDYCNLCHDGAGSGTAKHADGTVDISFNSAADLDAGNPAQWADGGVNVSAGTCSSLNANSCHATGDWDPDVANTFACNACHGFNSSWPTHTTDPTGTGWDTNDRCIYCHEADHPQNDASANSLRIPNTTGVATAVGINYGSGGIHLLKTIGGRAAQSTEAEICWTCHNAQSTKISEWGTNKNTGATTGADLPYNYGSLTGGNANWIVSGTPAEWNSANTTDFAYKKANIKSTHSANPAGTSAVSGTAYATGGMTETLDTVTNIRCSYCHNVHGGFQGDGSTAGSPYLRGTWKGNPYNEDGAPQSGMTGWDMTGTLNTSGTDQLGYGRVPRASVGSTNNGGVGGYWIDQNSGNPNGINSGDSDAVRLAAANANSGLCALCHGSSPNGTWASGEIDSLDYTTGENLWVGSNGHSNAVIGGTGSAKANIFTTANRGGPNPSSQNGDAMDMGAWSETQRGYSYRVHTGFGYGYQPVIVWDTGDSNRPYAYEAMEWGDSPGTTASQSNATFTRTPIAAGTVKLTAPGGSTAQSLYHTFNCGKCHNPHASRLPKLMITNCLDTNHNTWQDTQGSTDADTGVTDGEKDSNWMTSQNCHRRGPTEAAGEGGSGTAWGAGWNKVTPW